MVGGKNQRRRLSATLSSRVLSPPSLRARVSSSHLLLFVHGRLRMSLVSSPPSCSPDHPGLSWQEKITPFPLYIMNMPDEHGSQEYQSFKNSIRLLDLRQRKWFEFWNLLKLWPFPKPPAFRTQIPLKETPASCIAQQRITYREWRRRQKPSACRRNGETHKEANLTFIRVSAFVLVTSHTMSVPGMLIFWLA